MSDERGTVSMSFGDWGAMEVFVPHELEGRLSRLLEQMEMAEDSAQQAIEERSWLVEGQHINDLMMVATLAFACGLGAARDQDPRTGHIAVVVPVDAAEGVPTERPAL